MPKKADLAVTAGSGHRSHDHHAVLVAAVAAVLAGLAAFALSGTVGASAWRYLIVAGVVVGIGLISFAVYADWISRRVRRQILAERDRGQEIGELIRRLPDGRRHGDSRSEGSGSAGAA
jgi:hypothetical protein